MSSLDLDSTDAPNILEIELRQADDGRGRAREPRPRREDRRPSSGSGLTDAGLKTFTDGEVYCRYAESIRGADVFIVQSIVGNEPEGVNVNDALMELLVMIDAAVGASAHRVIAVTPWYGYSRQDKKSAPREPITARLVAKMLEVRRHRPRRDDGPARGPDAGLLLEDRRPHDRDADPHAVRGGPARAG